MQPDPEIPSTEDSDPDVQSSPAGLSQELKELADETDAEVGPSTDDD